MNELQKRAVALREQSGKALADARAMKEEFAKVEGEVPADKMAQFDKAIDDSTRFLDDAMKLERQAEALDRLEEQHSRQPATAALPRGTAPAADQHAKDIKAEAHKQAFRAYVMGEEAHAREILREAGYDRQEAHALISGDDSKGGFMVPDDFRAQVIERRAASAVIRSLASVIPTSRDTLVMPRIAAATGDYANSYASGFEGDWDTETGGTSTAAGVVTVKQPQDQPRSEMVRIPVHNWIPKPVECSMNLIEDTAGSWEATVARMIGTTAALDEDRQFIRGTGVNRPQGIVNGGSAQIVSGKSGGIAYAGILNLLYGLPSQYADLPGTAIVMRRATMGLILAIETGSGVDLVFKNALAGPNNLMGYPVRFSDFVDAGTTNGNNGAIFGNFAEGYAIADRGALRISRLVERFHPNVGFAPVARVGGGVVLPEAFRLLKIGTS